MKSQADKHRMEREFQQGDLVYMKLQPYVQSTMAARSNKKLSFRFYGPYKVLQRVGKVAYKLELPEGSRIHPVIHVSQLKKHAPKDVVVTEVLTSISTDPFQVQQPDKILHTRVIQRGANLIKQVLVQWSSMPAEMATWEDEADVPRDQAQVATG
jgi:ribosomal protein L21E